MPPPGNLRMIFCAPNDFSRFKLAMRHIRRFPEIFRCIASMSNWWEVTSAYVGLAPPSLPFEALFRNGMRHRFEEFYDLETLWQIFFHRVYDVRPSDRVVIDAGANIGLFACYATRRSPAARVVCIEPFPATYERLRETIRANRLDDRVTCLNQALDSSEGTAAMTSAAEASQMYRLASGDRGAGSVTVRTLTLARLLEDLATDTIDLLKMDIEGSEYNVLLTTPREILHRIRRINVEYHEPAAGASGSKLELIAHIEASGGRLIRDDGHARKYGMLHFDRPD